MSACSGSAIGTTTCFGHVRRGFVELLDEAGHDVGVGLVLRAVEGEVVDADHLGAAHEEDLDDRFARLAAGQAEDVLVGALGAGDRLALGHSLDRLELIADARGALVLHRRRSACAIWRFSVAHDLVRPPFEEEDDLLDDLVVLLLACSSEVQGAMQRLM